MTGRILADLGADVVKVEPPGGDPLRAVPPSGPTAPRCASRPGTRARRCVEVNGPDDPRLGGAARPGRRRAQHPRAGPAPSSSTRPGRPDAVWVLVTPFGSRRPAVRVAGERPRRHGVDREHVLHRRPRPGPGALHRAHGLVPRRARGGRGRAERAGLGTAPGRRRLGPRSGDDRVDGPRRPLPPHRNRGKRSGANVGITREIWPCADGFVSFGLRGGKARVANMQTITRLVAEDGLATPALTDRDWTTYDHNRGRAATSSTPSPRPSREYFLRHTMAELYEIAVETNLMLAPANSPRQLIESRQLEARALLLRARRRPRTSRAPSSTSRAPATPWPRPGRRARPAPLGDGDVRWPARPASAPVRARRRARDRRRRRRRRGRAPRSWSSAPARPGPSPCATSPSTAPPWCASSRARAPTSSAPTAWARATRAGSRARTCSTPSTWASSASPSTSSTPKAWPWPSASCSGPTPWPRTSRPGPCAASASTTRRWSPRSPTSSW